MRGERVGDPRGTAFDAARFCWQSEKCTDDIEASVIVLIGSREATQPVALYWLPAVIGTLAVLVGRAVAIYPITPLFRRTRMAVDGLTQHILFWGGLRGALALALALGAPASLPEHDALVSVAFAVVAFSIFIQGLTVPILLRRSARNQIR